jgi:hypothetical protein
MRYHTATFEEVDLISGENTVSITCTSGEDKIVFDWFETAYRRGYGVESNELKFTHNTGYHFAVSGFTTDSLAAYDVSDSSSPKRITNAVIAGAGPYSFTFEPPFEVDARTYCVLSTDQMLEPHSLTASRPHRLADSANGADWILITHRNLGWDAGGDPQPWLSDLVAHREAQGLRVKAVAVADIYDAFSYGIVSPQAIKDFIAYACENWQAPAPRYVLLVGDASYDVKDNWGSGSVTYVPSYLTFTQYLGETASDQWFVQISGQDALPDLSIGRLPANSAAEASAMVAKIIAYEDAPNSKSWEKAVLLVADNQTEAFESVFETINEDAAAMIPAAMDVPSRFYLQEYQQELLAVEDLTGDLINSLNTGALVLNYSGHAGYSTLAAERIWDNRGFAEREDCELLTNQDKYPLVISMSCMAGYFVYPEPWSAQRSTNYHSIAEGFIRPADHGAVAAIMPTGMSTTGGQHIFNNAIFEQIFTSDQRIIGDALLGARLTLLANTDAAYQQISDTFLLFGDPATALKLPLPRRPRGLTAERTKEASIRLSWQSALDCDGYPVAGYNLYRRAASESTFTKLNSTLIGELAFEHTGCDPKTLYYYAVSSIDDDGDESARSLSITAASSSSSSGGRDAASGCFVSAAAQPAPHMVWLILVIIVGLAAMVRRIRWEAH